VRPRGIGLVVIKADQSLSRLAQASGYRYRIPNNRLGVARWRMEKSSHQDMMAHRNRTDSLDYLF